MINRRELLALGLAAPLAEWTRWFPAAPPRIRVLADLRHTGTLAPVAATLTARDFGIAVPLPTYLADRDVLPAQDPEGKEIAPRLGMLRIESTEPATGIQVSASGEGATAIRLFRRGSNGWQRVAPESAGTWMLTPDAKGTLELGVGITLPEAAAGSEAPVWPRALTIEVGARSVAAQRVPFRVAPFIIPCALEPTDEALIVSRASTADAVKELHEWGERVRVKVTTLEAVEPCDVWMQDAIEPGVATTATPGGALQFRAIMSGQRREFGAGAAGLDRQIADQLRARGQVTIVQSVPRPRTRWIDWFGNLEVSPPHTDRQGRRFPYGRIIYGRQRELALHPDAVRFLEAQGMQWPPIILDTSWLSIGHVDEVINFVPARGAPGYKVLLPSPNAARELLDKLIAQQLGDLPVFAGTRDELTVALLRAGAAASQENATIDETVGRIRDQLKDELNLKDADFAMIPCLFTRGRALIPNAVNSLAVNGHLVATQPKGPRQGDKDVFEEGIRAALAGCAVDITFIDAWRAYHQGAGEVHCGTNAFRRLRDPAWWNHVGKTT